MSSAARLCLGVLGTVAATGLLTACVRRSREAPPPEPFVFRSLDLRQQTDRGEPAWDLTSPEARYDLIRQLAQVREPRGAIYRRGKPHITIRASRATVIGNGQAIQLEGAVQITLLGPDPVRISGDQVRWIPGEDLMVIDRRPVATDRRSRLSAREARYLLAQDRVELRGAPLLEQWSGPGPAAAPRGPAPIRVQALGVDWRPEQGDLTALGAVQGQRSAAGAAPAGTAAAPADLRLTASGLRGNLRAGFLDLLAPVRLRDQRGSGRLDAGRTRWLLNADRLVSDRPFEGAIRSLQARGNALRVSLADTTVEVPEACALDQPGEQLRAGRCLWNWSSDRFLAEGSVQLRRQAYRQITRASRLQGRIGKNGIAEFSSPGSRVNSRFSLQTPGQQGPAPRRATPPVVF